MKRRERERERESERGRERERERKGNEFVCTMLCERMWCTTS